MLKAISKKRILSKRNKIASSRITLARKNNFFEFWVSQREFCKKRVKGALPYARSVKAFFDAKFGDETNALIRKLEKYDQKVTVDGRKRPMFIVELAKWSVSTRTARCPCLDVGKAIQTGRMPDGVFRKYLKEKYASSWRNYQVAKQQMCLELYPGVCQLTPRGVELFAGTEKMTMKTSVQAGYPGAKRLAKKNQKKPTKKTNKKGGK